MRMIETKLAWIAKPFEDQSLHLCTFGIDKLFPKLVVPLFGDTSNTAILTHYT